MMDWDQELLELSSEYRAMKHCSDRIDKLLKLQEEKKQLKQRLKDMLDTDE